MLQREEAIAGAAAHPGDLEPLRAAFPGMTVRADADGGAPVVRHREAAIGAVRVAELRVRGGAVVTGTPLAGVVSAGVVLAGRLEARYARHGLDTARPFLRPAEPVVMRLRDVHLRTVEFDADAFRMAAERLSDQGAQRLRLLRTRPLDDDAADAWRWAAATLHDTLLVSSATNPVVVGQVFELGVRTLLATFGEPVTHASAGDVRAAPTAVRRAVAYLEEHAAGSITVPEVAAAARVSPRSLQALFRRHLGVTPVAHLHAIRLDAARRDLLAGGAAAATVHEIAVRWGFGNSGRFARLYAERFGERPSDTLRLG